MSIQTPKAILNGAAGLFARMQKHVLNGDEFDETEAQAESRKAVTAALRQARNIPQLHFDSTQTINVRDKSPWAMTLAKVEQSVGSGFLTALVGSRGSGKTQIAANLLCLHPGWFCSAMDFFIEIKSSFRRDSEFSEGNVIQKYLAFPLLVIDEVQERSESAWEDRLLTHLLNKRYGAKCDTLLISNQTPSDFTASIGHSIASRMSETGGIIECNWRSYR